MLNYSMTVIVLVIGLCLILADSKHKLQNTNFRTITFILISSTILYIYFDYLWVKEFSSKDFDCNYFDRINFFYFLIYLALPYVWFLFVQHYSWIKIKSKTLFFIFSIPIIIDLILVVLNFCGYRYIWIVGDSGIRYMRGSLFKIFSILNFFYFFVPLMVILFSIFTRKVKDRNMLNRTFGFIFVPALGVYINSFILHGDYTYPLLPCCFFIGIMYAYISIIFQIYNDTLKENLRLIEEAKVDAKIRELKDSVTSLLNNMPVLTFSKDVENGKYMACNQLFAEYANKESPEGVVGLTDFEIFDSVTAKHFVEDDKKALSMDKPYVFFEDVPDAAGNQKQFQTTKLKFTDVAGRLCTLGMCVDVTEMMSIKKETDLAKMANEAKTRFLFNMSHDIRTPMNAIIGFTDLAMRNVDDSNKMTEFLSKISSSSHHLLSLINDVLEMSRIESGKLVLNETANNLPDLLHNLNNIIINQVEEKHHELTMETVSLVHENVFCDKLRLNQVLFNLLSNSIKYTPDGGKITLILIENDTAPEGYGAYEIRVRDNGIGMSPEFVKKVFDAFERENTSTVSGIEGTGLGMAITKRIVDLMKGTITIETKQNAGTEFTVKFNLRLQNDDLNRQSVGALKEINTIALEKDKDIKPISFRGKRLLLVEDIEINREIATMMLSIYNLEVDIAKNGKEALEKVKNSKSGYYDLILMDIQMPIMNGYEATVAIRALKNKELASIPIIALTANAFDEDKQKALDCGMNGHISKPIEGNQILQILHQYLDNKG